MMNERWFHGDMNKEQARTMLGQKEIGTYLVRFSSNSNSLVISAVVPSSDKKAVVAHFRVSATNKGLKIQKSKMVDSEGPHPNMKILLEMNSTLFRQPQSTEAAKFAWLTRLPSSYVDDIGYQLETSGK